MELEHPEQIDLLHGVERSADVRNALAHLSTVEVAVIALKFGFLYSHRDIAYVLHISCEEVTRIKRDALQKIRQRL